MKFKNSATGKIVEAIGCWPVVALNGSVEVSFISGQNHALLDHDSPIRFIHYVAAHDMVSGEDYDVYWLPEDWELMLDYQWDLGVCFTGLEFEIGQ